MKIYQSLLKLIMIFEKKKCKRFTMKKLLLLITEPLVGTASTISSSTLAKLNLSAGIILSSITALLTSIAISISIGYILKLKKLDTILKDWITVITSLYEKTLKTSRVH